jgi:hypothetical protein
MNKIPVEPSMIEMHKECSMTLLTPRSQRVFKQAAPVFAVALIMSLSGTAQAQNALGDGTALDANTGQNGPRNYQRPNFADELRFRNAIATGNAPGGLSFRGDLGYRAAGEFSGELGSDALFAFRRDSLYSGLAGMGIRGTDAIQYQFALTTGAAPPQNLMGSLSLSRDSYYASTSGSQGRITGPDTTIGLNQEAADLDIRGKQLSAPVVGATTSVLDTGSMLGTLRSSSTYATTANLQPALMSVYTEGIDRKQIGLIASPLLGITSTPMYEEDPEAPNALVARPPNAVADPNATGIHESTRMATSYEALVEQMRVRVEEMRQKSDPADQSTIKSDESNDAWLIRQMQELRDKLYGTKPANEDDPNATDPTTPDLNSPSETDPAGNNTGGDSSQDPSITTDPLSKLNESIQNSMSGTGSIANPVELYDPTVMAIDPETLEVLRGAAALEIDQLLDPGAADRDIYAEHMAAGQRLIRDGRYFDAEERFTHALSIKPYDIPSQLGRLHAQIGAGMVLSASVNLQSIFSQHPELIGSRYTGKLLPGEQRIIMLVDRLKERSGILLPELSTRITESDRVRVSAAMLLAYIGYQIEDQDAVTSGLSIVKEYGSDADRRFASLLGQIWTGHDIVAPKSDPGSGSAPESNRDTQED